MKELREWWAWLHPWNKAAVIMNVVAIGISIYSLTVSRMALDMALASMGLR